MTPTDANGSAAPPHGALPPGSRLGEFELRSVIGVGGFGIVYLAFDHALEREVAIKEYMPAALAGRTSTSQVTPLTAAHTESFETGLRSFVNEGRMLAKFDSPSLLKVHRYWEANGTAYIAMPLYRGRTLKEVRSGLPVPPDEASARALLAPLLQAIDKLHQESIFHRDIAPDNILIEADGRPVLLDFGAARRIGDGSHAPTAILKPAYAPIEQYAEAASVKQGPWTDLYALGATLHFWLLGEAPAPSTARAVADDMQPLAERGVPGCSTSFLQAIDWMLAPLPAERPPSVAALREVLEGRAAVPPRRMPRVAPAIREPPQPDAAAAAVDIALDLLEPAPALPSDAPTVRLPPAPPPPPSTAAPPIRVPDRPAQVAPTTAQTASGNRWAVPAATAAVVAVVAAWWSWPRPQSPGPVEPAAAVAPAPVPQTAPPPRAEDSTAVSEPSSTVTPAVALPTAPQRATDTPVEPAAPARVATPAPAVVPKSKPAAETPRAPEAAASVRRARPPTANDTTPVAAETAPVPTARPAPQPAPATAEAAAPRAAAPAAPSAPVAAAMGAREICGRRVFIALVNCMNRECAKPEFRDTPECAMYKPPN